MLIFTILIAILIFLINFYIAYSLFKANKNYSYCILLSLIIAMVYISIGVYFYPASKFFPMVFMLISSIACGGVFGRAKPRVNVNRDNITFETNTTITYDIPVIYIKFILISVIFIVFTFFMSNYKRTGLSKEELTHRQNLISMCKELIKERVLIKSSLDTHDIIGTSYYQAPTNGNEVIMIDFDVRNAFGIEIKYTAKCFFSVDGSPEIEILDR